MATTYVEIDETYTPHTSDQQISVVAQIGDGQIGDYSVFLDRALKKKDTPIGKKSEILNKRIIVSATVVDVMNETNWTSLTIKIKEGAKEKTYGPYSREAANHLDTVIYIVKILNTNV
ncbi:MAG TPA: hypothetical protein VF868_13600 [Bacteroidia bacterium]|jgi:hypothetical protein